MCNFRLLLPNKARGRGGGREGENVENFGWIA